jgi:predicted unusual protein kinase regulating ubiquinone biosynthesis (AarF/ABC1/UbiB family)
MDINFDYYSTRIYNLFYVFTLLLKNGLFYIYYRDSLKFIKNLTFDIERFNYTYIKILQTISCNSLIFTDDQKDFLLKYSNQVPFKQSNHDYQFLLNLEEKYKGELRINKDSPINSGIVALVYEGYLWANKGNDPDRKEHKIVIKILKKDVTKLLNIAWQDLEFFTKLFDYLPILNKYKLNKLIDFNKDYVIDQLNFSIELENLKLWKDFSNKIDYLEVPQYFEEFTKEDSNILIMEYLENISIKELSKELKSEYAVNLIKSVFVGSFFYGIIHGDLHSGNVLLLENSKIGIIDFGIACKISRDEQNAMYNFYKNSLFDQDTKKASLNIKDLVHPRETLNNLSFDQCRQLYKDVENVIQEHFVINPDPMIFVFNLTYVLSKYKLTISKGFANTIYGISAGINLNIELMNAKSSNPIREYNSLSLSIIKNLCQEIDFSLD